MALLHSINDLKKTDKLGVTTLNNESYNSWRASSFKKTTVDKLSLKVKQNNSYKSDQKLIKPSYNFKLIHASCEFQDNYLENKHFIKKTENKAENLNKFFSKNEQNPNIFETDNKTFIEKLEKKANNFNPELNLYNIMKIVTKELDNDEESRNLKEKIRPPNKMELLQRIKTQSLHTIQESIKKTEVDKLKNLTKIEISKISNDMSYLLDKSLREKLFN